MIALFDIDSLIYLACYMLEPNEDFINKHKLHDADYDTIMGFLATIAQDRLTQMKLSVLNDIEEDDNGIEITGVEVFVTTCSKSIRKQIYPEYKANRKTTELSKLVYLVRDNYVFYEDAIGDDIYEADDLIADRARQLESEGKQYIVVTMDKDLQQIGGFLYNYYKKPSLKDSEGNIIETYPRKGLFYYSKFDGMKFLAKQMLMGDLGDNVKGIPKKGIKFADKVIDPINTKFGLIRQVIHEYKQHFKEEYAKQLQLHFRLLYLGRY